MVAISQKNPLDDEDTVIEGVVLERAHRFITFVPSFLFSMPFKQLFYMNFSIALLQQRILGY
jgi:hypothetical protein